jgi:Domain of unknown function (DUF4918)
MSLLSDRIIKFYQGLMLPENLPRDFVTLYPQRDPTVLGIVEIFFEKFYADNHPRHLIFGINPGRFGAGTTGINFTAPKQLTAFCGISNSFKQQSELSAEFIYEVIERYGGCKKFYREFFITAVSPLGFTRQGVNINYYDDKKLQTALQPFILQNIQKQLEFGVHRNACICIGGEKNFKFLSALNDEYHFFRKIIPLPHPRFILQYRRPFKESYILQYLSALEEII